MGIFEKYIKYIESFGNKDFLFEDFVYQLNPLINFYLKKFKSLDKYDLRQDILMKLHKVLENNRFKINILSEIINDDSTNKDYNFFVEKYKKTSTSNQTIYNNRKSSKEDYNIYIDSIKDFIGNIKLINFLDNTINNLCIDIWRKKKENKIFFLDIEVVDKRESIYKKIKVENILEEYKDLLSESDYRYITQFIEVGKVLTQKELAIKIGVSHQSVSKRIKKIINSTKSNKIL